MNPLKPYCETIAQTDWTPLAELLREHGHGWVRARITSNGIELEAIGPTATHCPTCQCNKLADADLKRAPDNPQSKTWHW